MISQENYRLTRLVEHFLCFSKLDNDRWNFDFAPFPAGEIAMRAAQAARARFLAPDCRFAVELEAELPHIHGDEEALSTALINLLDNAYKFSGEKKEIVLQAHAQNGHVVFSVKDNGIGIAPRNVKRIFRPYQVDQRLARSSSGVGLGLSIVQQIVSAHGGETTVQSKPGCGSCFNIVLPAFGKD